MAAPQEQKKSYFVMKDFSGLNTKANRTAIRETEFSWIENLQPIGHGNVKCVPTYSLPGVTFNQTVSTAFTANVNNVEYYFAFESDGSLQAVNLSSYAVTNIAAAAKFSTSGVYMTQWKNERILIIDPVKGMFTWDGTNLVSVGSVQNIVITSGGAGYVSAPSVTISAPNETGGIQATATATITGGAVTSITITEAGTGYTTTPTITFGSGAATATASYFNQPGTAIASFSGRVWIANGRTVYYSASDRFNDFTTVSAGFIVITDSTMTSSIRQLLSANNFLYVFGDDSINVFSDVRVTNQGVTIFTNTNVSASIGCPYPDAIFSYFRSILFMNRYGIFALVGSTATKISDALDGVFSSIDFTKPIIAGQAIINNTLCAVFLFTYGSRVIQSVFFEKKWFLTSQGDTLTRISSASISGVPTIYGVDASKRLVKAYSDTTSNITTTIQTALWGFEDNIRDKQSLKMGIEIATGSSPVMVSATIDNENRSSAPYSLANYVNLLNNNGQVIPLKNNLGSIIPLVGVGFFLYKTDAQQWGKYLGITATSSVPGYVISGFELEYVLRVRF